MEIGVRKVMGASISNIIQLISKEYLMLVIVSFVVAVPVTYGIMNQWLQGFAYRIGWNGWYFVVGLIIALGVVLITVISKAVAAAAINPVKVLRGE
jgi:putative ABC transport system permease protein